MYDSLKEYCIEFELYILCLDDFTFEYFKSRSSIYPEIRTLTLNEIEQRDDELKTAKANRSRIEYYFTLSPCLPLYILKKYQLPHVCSLDADILFLDSPQSLFKYLDEYSIIVTPHKFSKENKQFLIHGIYNVSFQIFKNDETGIDCLSLWRNQCIEWCGDRPDLDNDRFADQKYLDAWTKLYLGRVKVLDDSVSGLAPWNLNNFTISKKSGKFYSNGELIIFYHFHHFKIFSSSWASNGFNHYKAVKQKAVDSLYLLYWNKLNKYRPDFSNADVSARYEISNEKWTQIFRENFVYYKFIGLKLVHYDMEKLPNFLKKKLNKSSA